MTADSMQDMESDHHKPAGAPHREVSEDCAAAPVKAASLRTVHLSNIANVAYANCKMLESRGISVEVYCHDMTHVMSQPEWNDLALNSADFPDENNFFNNTADLSKYSRPDWFHSGTLFSLMLSNEAVEGGGRGMGAARLLATPVHFAFRTLIRAARVLPVEIRERVKQVTFYPAYNYLHGSAKSAVASTKPARWGSSILSRRVFTG